MRGNAVIGDLVTWGLSIGRKDIKRPRLQRCEFDRHRHGLRDDRLAAGLRCSLQALTAQVSRSARNCFFLWYEYFTPVQIVQWLVNSGSIDRRSAVRTKAFIALGCLDATGL